MSIQIFNGVRNTLGTPAIITDTISNRPTASTQAEGTLFFASDTPDIYQVISGNWKSCGGGGGSQSWQNTLLISGILTQNNIIDGANNNLLFTGFTTFEIVYDNLNLGSQSYENFIQMNLVSGNYVFSGFTAGHDINYIHINPDSGVYFIGDFQGVHNSTSIVIDDAVSNMTFTANTRFNLQTGEIRLTSGNTSLLSNTSHGSTGQHLIVIIDGTTYKIALLAN